jgi:hypothetical protein
MSGFGRSDAGGAGRRWSIDAGRLWVGGVMAGIVGAGIVVVGFLIARGILDIPVLIEREGKLVNASVWWYAAGAFAAALVAAGLLHVLLAGSPRPFTFYGWITGLAVAIVALVPFTTSAELETKLSICAINLAAGIVMATVIGTVGRSALRIPGESPYPAAAEQLFRPDYPPYGQGEQPGRW